MCLSCACQIFAYIYSRCRRSDYRATVFNFGDFNPEERIPSNFSAKFKIIDNFLVAADVTYTVGHDHFNILYSRNLQTDIRRPRVRLQEGDTHNGSQLLQTPGVHYNAGFNRLVIPRCRQYPDTIFVIVNAFAFQPDGISSPFAHKRKQCSQQPESYDSVAGNMVTTPAISTLLEQTSS